MADTLSKAKDAASAALSELQETVSTKRQIAGLRRKITDLVAERDRVMLEIGRKVYALYGRDKVRNQDILPLCERIEQVGEGISELNEQVRELAKPKPKGVLQPAELQDETELAEEEDAEEGEAEAEAEEEEAPEEVEAPAEEEGEDAADAEDEDAEAEGTEGEAETKDE